MEAPRAPWLRFDDHAPHRMLGALRAIAELDDDDLKKLAKCFSTWVND